MNKTKSTRAIHQYIKYKLGILSARRCEFEGCNKLLDVNSLTGDKVNLAEHAHVSPYSDNGPRGKFRSINPNQDIHDISNLMLLCPECHTTIDRHPEKYTVDILLKMKKDHEDRIKFVTGFKSDKKTQVLTYFCPIQQQEVTITQAEIMEALFPNYYPLNDPIAIRDNSLSMPILLETEVFNIKNRIDRYVKIPNLHKTPHFSLFALAPIPLLIKLGFELSDKMNVDVYQLHRNPKTWKWQEDAPEYFSFQLIEPENKNLTPIVVLAVSGKIDLKHIYELMGPDISIWEIIVGGVEPGNDIIRSKWQIIEWRKILSKMFEHINQHSKENISIFPAIAVSCAVELGRIRMDSAHAPWIIYNRNNSQQFEKTITIGGSND